MSIKEKVKLLGEMRGLSLSEIERRAGIGNSTICKWDRISPMIDKVWKVANVLNVTIDELVKDIDLGGEK